MGPESLAGSRVAPSARCPKTPSKAAMILSGPFFDLTCDLAFACSSTSSKNISRSRHLVSARPTQCHLSSLSDNGLFLGKHRKGQAKTKSGYAKRTSSLVRAESPTLHACDQGKHTFEPCRSKSRSRQTDAVFLPLYRNIRFSGRPAPALNTKA